MTDHELTANNIETLATGLVPLNNKISEFYAAIKSVTIIDRELLKRLEQAQVIDLTKTCNGLLYVRNSTSGISIHELISHNTLSCPEFRAGNSSEPMFSNAIILRQISIFPWLSICALKVLNEFK